MASDGFPSCVLNFLGIFSESHLSVVHSFSESLIGTSMLDQSCCCHVIWAALSGGDQRCCPQQHKKKGLTQEGGELRRKKIKRRARNTAYFPQPQMARTGALTQVFICIRRAARQARADATRGDGSQAPSTAEAQAQHTRRPIHDRNPTHGGSDGLLSNLAAAGRRSEATLHRCPRQSGRPVTSSPCGVR